MNTLEAFAMGEDNRGKELMVFDWDKAARSRAKISEEAILCSLPIHRDIIFQASSASDTLRSTWETTIFFTPQATMRS